MTRTLQDNIKLLHTQQGNARKLYPLRLRLSSIEQAETINYILH